MRGWVFFIPKLFFDGGGGAWVVSGGEKLAPVAGGVREGAGLSISAGPVVIGGVGGAWRLGRWDTVSVGERCRFYLTAVGCTKFKEILGKIEERRQIHGR